MPTSVSNMCISTLRAACEREKCGSTVSVAALMAATSLPPGAGSAAAAIGSAALARPAAPSLTNSRRDVSRLIVASSCAVFDANHRRRRAFDQSDSAALNAGMDKPEIVFLGTGPDWYLDRFAHRFTLHLLPDGKIAGLARDVAGR